MALKTVLEALASWSSVQPDKPCWTFLSDKAEPMDSFTYMELDRTTSLAARHLLEKHNLRKGDRVLLVFFPGLHFTVSLLACFKAGLIAVPVFPPDPRKMKKDLDHFINIQMSSGAKTALTNAEFNFAKKVENLKCMFSRDAKAWPELTWIQMDEVMQKGKSSTAATGDLPAVGMNDIAFLQYTSGSTSEPKGVMISHENLSHNLAMIIHELRANTETINVSWLPQYHDMGLIGSYLGLLYCGGKGYYLSPISFLKDPIVWVKALSQCKGTHTQAPSFAFALVSRKFNETMSDPSWAEKVASTLDLSTVQHMINAAEPVDAYAIRNFYDTFQKYGLPSNVVVPTYGLAEHTVFVCSGGKQILTVTKESLESGDINVVRALGNFAESNEVDGSVPVSFSEAELQDLVGCGYPDNGDGVDLRIMDITDDQSLRELPELKVGEIWVQSKSKARGYWQQPEVTARDFHAAADGVGTGFLRTGDLGFMYGRELFICGRLKDLIIIGGSNHYPQDIERSAELASPSLRAGCSAAFSVSQGGSEKVVYVAELKEGVSSSLYEDIRKTIAEVVASEHGLALSVIYLLKTRTIPKTTSGKIARSWCRKAYQNNSLQTLYQWAGSSSSKVAPISEEELEESKNNAVVGVAETSSLTALSKEEVRALTLEEIVDKLETILRQISMQSPSPMTSAVSPTDPISSLGLDSMSLVQFKGVLENRFYCDIPDDFMFTSMATLNGLAESVKVGTLTEEQKRKYENSMDQKKNDGDMETTIPISQKEPCCPWFLWCY